LDFIGIIRSLEELLYEVMGWLIFYPRTLWRILVRPDQTTRYSEEEQDDTSAGRYSDTLSPPLLLMITLVITHALGVSVGVDGPKAAGEIGEALVGSPRNLLITRALIFATIPLVIAGIALQGRGIPIDRQTLRMPFYSQCFLLTPFALMMQTAMLLPRIAESASAVAAGLALVALVWFVWAQTSWFARRMALSRRKAFGWAAAATSVALLASLVVAVLIALALWEGSGSN
jgi:hypothetical protein